MRKLAPVALSMAMAAGCGGKGSPGSGAGGSASSSTSASSSASTAGGGSSSSSSSASSSSAGSSGAASSSSSSSSASSSSGSASSGGASSSSSSGVSIAHEWDTAGSYGGPGFGTFSCTFTVPDAPAYDQQSVFLWCGVQQASGVSSMGDTSFGVLQPVLMFGPDCVQALPEGAGFGPGNDPTYDANPYWYYSSQYVYPSPRGSLTYQCTSGPVFKASPGDVLVSTFTMTASGATVSIVGPNQTGNSTLSAASPWNEAGQSWSQFLGSADQVLVEAAVEVWSIHGASDWPAAFTSGWSVAASITPASGLSTGQWQLVPWNNGSLKVACSNDAATYGSNCTWTQ